MLLRISTSLALLTQAVGLLAAPQALRAQPGCEGRALVRRQVNDEDAVKAARIAREQRELVAYEKAHKDTQWAEINIGVYTHVMMVSRNDQNVTNEKIRQDIAELNRAYKPAKISFTLKEAFWAHKPPALTEYKQPKEFIHQGGPASLNVYYWTELKGRGVEEAHGIAAWPWLLNDTVDEFGLSGTAHDGVDLVKVPHFKHSLVHEVGHWLGLVHSFTTVGDHGDWIDDTPLNPSGTDKDVTWPPDNFMAYSDKATTFTRGQMSRMRATWAKWRAGDKTPAPVRAHSLPRIAPSTPKGPNTGGKFAFYPNPKDNYFTYRMCSTFSGEFTPEVREQYCGTRAYCIFGHYEGEEIPEGQDRPRYRKASECLRDRFGSGPAKLPWMESDEAKVPSDPSGLAEYHEEIMGTSFICEVIPELTKKQKILSKGQDLTGKWRSEAECVAAHENRPFDLVPLAPTSMWERPIIRP